MGTRFPYSTYLSSIKIPRDEPPTPMLYAKPPTTAMASNWNGYEGGREGKFQTADDGGREARSRSPFSGCLACPPLFVGRQMNEAADISQIWPISQLTQTCAKLRKLRLIFF